jgi:two-component system, sensor histidine kinase PdtaS
MFKAKARTLAAALLTIAVVVLAAITATILWQAYLETLARLHTQALASAHVVSTHTRWIIGSSRQAIRHVDALLGPDPAVIQDDTKRAIAEVVSAMEAPVAAWVFDPGGRPVFATPPGNLEFRLDDRPFFQDLKEGRIDQYISPLIIGASTKQQNFYIVNRLTRDARFAGLITISVPVTVMSEVLSSLSLSPGSTVSLFKTDGWLVARFPLPDGPMNLSNYVLFTEHLPRNAEGSYDAISPADGVRRVVGYSKIGNESLVALASIAANEEFKPFWAQLRWSAALLFLLLIALTAVIGWLFLVLRRQDRDQVALAGALGQNQTLLQEVHHRVKNNLQAVASLIHLAPLDQQLKQDMALRLSAMAAIHEQAYRSEQYSDVPLQEYLTHLIEDINRAYGNRAEYDADLDPVVVTRDQALPIGLLTNEVLSNAFKHAFPDGRRARIAIALKMTSPQMAELRIRDNGVGYDPSSKSNGIGSRLIKGLVSQLDGEATTIIENGTTFILCFAPAGTQGIRPSAS